MDGEQLARGAGAQGVGIIHAEPVRDPVIGISGKLGEFVGAVGGGRERLLELVVGTPVIPADT